MGQGSTLTTRVRGLSKSAVPFAAAIECAAVPDRTALGHRRRRAADGAHPAGADGDSSPPAGIWLAAEPVWGENCRGDETDDRPRHGKGHDRDAQREEPDGRSTLTRNDQGPPQGGVRGRPGALLCVPGSQAGAETRAR